MFFKEVKFTFLPFLYMSKLITQVKQSGRLDTNRMSSQKGHVMTIFEMIWICCHENFKNTTITYVVI